MFKLGYNPGAEGQGEKSGTNRIVCPTVPLERTQEVQQILLLLRAQLFEIADDDVGFRTEAGVFLDGVDEIGGAAIVEKENSLTESPQRSGAELIGAGAALRDAVGEICSHVVDEQVRV